MPITIRDLARSLNLSITTVSRALDGYTDVATQTRQRVLEAAREQGYEPSYAARHLRRQQADAIGYILPAHSPQFFDSFYSNFLAGICDECSAHHMDVVISSAPPNSAEEQAIYRQWIQSGRVDGFLLNRIRVQDWRIDTLQAAGVPFAGIGRAQNGRDYPCIVVNERGGFLRLVQHLAERGHRRIAMVSGPAELVISAERLHGYLDGLSQLKLPFDPELIIAGDLSEEGGYLAARRLLSLAAPPTAILGCNDRTAIGIIRAAQDNGLVIGEELAVAGYDGIGEAACTTPPLTTVVQPTYEISRRLTDKLLQMLSGNPPDPLQETVEPVFLPRASSG